MCRLLSPRISTEIEVNSGKSVKRFSDRSCERQIPNIREDDMPKFAANLTMLFNEVPFLERFALASEAGFEAVEYLFPYDYNAEELKQELSRKQPCPGPAQSACRQLGSG